MDVGAGLGVAAREFQLPAGPCDYLLRVAAVTPIVAELVGPEPGRHGFHGPAPALGANDGSGFSAYPTASGQALPLALGRKQAA